mmetsp:Transcript_20599/g.28786  ORF Transcript_20599/g.28786 Transcript_20599/m.28786 type:complete len:81 (+) Transcript_20599:1407-1649(+)
MFTPSVSASKNLRLIGVSPLKKREKSALLISSQKPFLVDRSQAHAVVLLPQEDLNALHVWRAGTVEQQTEFVSPASTASS